MGYNDTRDTLSLYHQGTGGLDELRQHLSDEVLYGFARVDKYKVLITYMNEQVSGVRRARALVHGRIVGGQFEHDLQISASSDGELSETAVRARLRQVVGDSDAAPAAETPAGPDDEEEEVPDEEPAASTPEPAAEPASAPAAPPPSNPPPSAPTTSAADAPSAAAHRSPPVSNGSGGSAAHARVAVTAVAPEVQEDRAKIEAEARRRQMEEAERLRREQLQKKMLQAEKSAKGDQLSGYITVQGGDCYFWKRRYFVLKGKTMFLYRDEADKLPVSSLDMGGTIQSVVDAQEEVLIPNSFKVGLKGIAEPYYFYADSKEQKDAAMHGIQKCA
ncbi:hypothetical protein SYNPS1DRAFT_27445 [Syncephalis pseudoplumigaleata]|uniref:PH domain-containing protein n=1 Tax=Syncephalis pseudoplumigaleata TaxID=1712513 RepID=A0A4P9Z3B6_9FUNG|nr:hypothetical protein SYNPS1DRAFT_27445 [Syncephalis pseudoplumigaleata]|eukprot:RKP26878.1 hypothetical protein SYNPS1DRAFT_27445 [Syncephalis pseudoplumigaleata]